MSNFLNWAPDGVDINTILLVLLLLTLWIRSILRRNQIKSLISTVNRFAIKLVLTPEAIKEIADAAIKQEAEAAKKALQLAQERESKASRKLADSSDTS